MENQQYSVGLDIGTTKIVAIVGRRNEHGKIEVMGVGKAKSLGVHKGIVNNISQTITSIKAAVEEAQKSAGVPIKNVTVGIAGKHIRSLQHSDYIMRENPETYITEDDIEKLKDQVNLDDYVLSISNVMDMDELERLYSQNEILLMKEKIYFENSDLIQNFIISNQEGEKYFISKEKIKKDEKILLEAMSSKSENVPKNVKH